MSEWACAGCGVLSPNRMRSCACPTNVVVRGRAQEWKIDDPQEKIGVIENMIRVWFETPDKLGLERPSYRALATCIYDRTVPK
jgi:hypothetical protein